MSLLVNIDYYESKVIIVPKLTWKLQIRRSVHVLQQPADMARHCVLEHRVDQPEAGLLHVSRVQAVAVAVDYDPSSLAATHGVLRLSHAQNHFFVLHSNAFEVDFWQILLIAILRMFQDLRALVNKIAFDQHRLVRFRKADDARSTVVIHVMSVAEREVSFKHFVAEFDTEALEKLVQSGNVASACVRHPPLPCVLVVELHVLHDRRVEPVSEDDHAQVLLDDVLAELSDFFVEILFLWIDDQQSSIV